jgi:hypothetical protein
MNRSLYRPKPHSDLLLRVFDLPGRGMTPALAESILAFDFPDGDAARIEELNVKANEGQLTEEEVFVFHKGSNPKRPRRFTAQAHYASQGAQVRGCRHPAYGR